jgi:hypothetical protein
MQPQGGHPLLRRAGVTRAPFENAVSVRLMQTVLKRFSLYTPREI